MNTPLRVLFATAELSPIARVGGLAAAAAGLVQALRVDGVDVDVVVPDYRGLSLAGEQTIELEVPSWASPATARRGRLDGVGEITLIHTPGIERPHPYLQPDGQGWHDNDERFMRFSAALGALCATTQPDVLHLNDWHTSASLAFFHPWPATVLTVHTLGYQGRCAPGWVFSLPHYREAFMHQGDVNPLAGAVRLVDAIIAVSPTYAREITTAAGGFGLEGLLAGRGEALRGILNGIDDVAWNPMIDPFVSNHFGPDALAGKSKEKTKLRRALGLPASSGPLAVMVTRLVEQKGVDLLLPLLGELEALDTQLVVLGDGDRLLVDALTAGAGTHSERFVFCHGYDEGLAHRLTAAGDLFLMPSRFEPCGLAQMQAMRYGTLPVVTDVGGLHDTVIDIDANPQTGTGLVARSVDTEGLLDALRRGVSVVGDPKRLKPARRAGMLADWSWRAPAEEHVRLYRTLLASRAGLR
jgi:starch synthase